MKRILGLVLLCAGGLAVARAETVPEFIEQLKSPETIKRRFAAVGLGKLGPKGKDAIPALLDTVARDKEKDVRVAAVTAIRSIVLKMKDRSEDGKVGISSFLAKRTPTWQGE